jgi:hypothetical protein
MEKSNKQPVVNITNREAFTAIILALCVSLLLSSCASLCKAYNPSGKTKHIMRGRS